MLIFSPNMLKTYKTCPKKFYYRYVVHLNVPQTATPFEKGKKIHALANYYLQGVNISRIETVLSSDEKRLWELLKTNEFFQKQYYKSEYKISCKISDYWIGGRLDAVVKDGENYYILDYKTGFPPKNPEYDFQTMVYMLCLDKILKNYDKLSFVYISLKENKNHITDFNPQYKLEYEQRLVDICGKISQDSLYSKCTSACEKCEYKNICKHL